MAGYTVTSGPALHGGAPIESVRTAAYRIPTDRPEADGTFAWDSTTLVTVDVRGGGMSGFGYSYGSSAMVDLIGGQLSHALVGLDALAVEAAWNAMLRQVRNIGRPGMAAMAIGAVDAALWDLKCKLLGVPLVTLLGAAREAAPVYGSGGFTSYSPDELCAQLRGFVEQGMRRVKMKIGTHPEHDLARVRAARAALGDDVELMVDANGAYERKQALSFAQAFAEQRVTWFEEPVSSDDLDGLRMLRDRAPAGMAIAAGEYGYDTFYFRRMLQAGAVDILQADGTRCLGVTGFLAAARLCQAFNVPLSSHCAPAFHAHLACAATPLVHIEYFYDHARIEQMLFDGYVAPRDGLLSPDRTRPGIGVELKRASAERYAI
jgi:L-alanine-DL-glutamate epimerase-like enolase superfamily enzyme